MPEETLPLSVSARSQESELALGWIMNEFDPNTALSSVGRFFRRMLERWKQFPEQVKRLTVLLGVVVFALLTARTMLVPADFGKYGHYRASAVDEIAALPIQYAGHEICNECHDDVVETKAAGFHKNVGCEVCHGPAAAHTEDVEAGELLAPRGREGCPLCHEYLPSRPTGFPQIVSASHNPVKPCIACHEAHDPKPPETPKECSACHATIARSKAISHHAYVACTRCHEAPDEHKEDPRSFRPSKPEARAFCAGCHDDDTAGKEGIPQIDQTTHEERYVCWQCHYPHLPEAQ